MKTIANLIDYTNLRQDAIDSDIISLCEEAKKFGFASVCVNPVHVKLAASILKNDKTKTCSVIGFPLGANSFEMKFAETRFLVHQGVEEVDMVLNIGALKEGKHDVIKQEISKVVDASDGICVKVIIEACLLNDEEKIVASKIAIDAGAAFIKTSTGFSFNGATIEDVRLIRKTVGNEVGVKASGGINTLKKVQSMIDAGANRIGTSSGASLMI
tara:strand:- start:209 stop:850 length:642 start_codon:yes stop_codon:yes gene_type:complete